MFVAATLLCLLRLTSTLRHANGVAVVRAWVFHACGM